MIARRVRGAKPANRSATERTYGSNSSSGNTLVTNPMRSASSARNFSASRYSSRALAGPTMRGKVHVPPKSPDNPAVMNAVLNTAEVLQ